MKVLERAGSLSLLTTTLLVGCGEQATTPVIPGRDLALFADGTWLRDELGRVVILRGMNYSGMEFGNFVGTPTGPQAADFAQMASWGVNAVRVPISWQYLEPAPNQFNLGYLTDNLDPVVSWAAANDILVIPEMHQFYTSPCFGDTNDPPQWSGIGFPTWACEGRYAPEDHFVAMCDFFEGALADDGRPLYHHFIEAWELVATHYAQDRRIGGFDLFNEPMCVGDLKAFQRDHLNPVLRETREALIAAGAPHTWFYSPVVTRNLGFGVTPEYMGPNVVYAPHLYTQTGGLPTSKYNGNAAAIATDYDLAQAEARAMSAPMLVAEFGGNTEAEDGFLAATTQFLTDSLNAQDAHMVGGLWWAYFPGDNTFSIVDGARQPKGELANTFARPYAQLVAGVPKAAHYDAAAARLTLTYDPKLEGLATSTTQVYVPPAWFAAGLEISVPAGATYELLPARHRLLVTATATGEQTVVISRQGASSR